MVVGFERRTYTVGEDGGQVELCVNITVPRRQDIGTVAFNLTVETHNGSAGISYSRSQNAICFTLIGCGGMFINASRNIAFLLLIFSLSLIPWHSPSSSGTVI